MALIKRPYDQVKMETGWQQTYAGTAEKYSQTSHMRCNTTLLTDRKY